MIHGSMHAIATSAHEAKCLIGLASVLGEVTAVFYGTGTTSGGNPVVAPTGAKVVRIWAGKALIEIGGQEYRVTPHENAYFTIYAGERP